MAAYNTQHTCKYSPCINNKTDHNNAIVFQQYTGSCFITYCILFYYPIVCNTTTTCVLLKYYSIVMVSFIVDTRRIFAGVPCIVCRYYTCDNDIPRYCCIVVLLYCLPAVTSIDYYYIIRVTRMHHSMFIVFNTRLIKQHDILQTLSRSINNQTPTV